MEDIGQCIFACVCVICMCVITIQILKNCSMNHDITHCEGKYCPLKETCYRYAAYKELDDTETHAWVFKLIPYESGECEFYSKIK